LGLIGVSADTRGLAIPEEAPRWREEDGRGQGRWERKKDLATDGDTAGVEVTGAERDARLSCRGASGNHKNPFDHASTVLLADDEEISEGMVWAVYEMRGQEATTAEG